MALLASTILSLCHCSKPSSPSTGTVTGTVTLENQSNYQGVTVTLYVPTEIDQELSDIQSLHPDVGLSIDQRLVFDHRLANAMATTETASDGSYTFENIPSGGFVVLAEMELFGYQERFDLMVKSGSKTVVPQIDLLEEKELGGNLASSITLDANRYYVVSSDVTVLSGATLTIEPGAHIGFDGYHTLLINGNLNAVGSEEEMIVFTSRKKAPVPGDWRRIEFNSSSEEAEMRWCKVEYATIGIYGNGAWPALGYNVIRNNVEKGLLCVSTFDTPIEVTNNLIMNNDNGIWLENVHEGVIQGNIVFGNQESGIGCQESSPILKNNLCMTNKYGLYIVYESNPQCQNTLLMSNVYGMACGGYSKPLVHLCNFTHNSQAAIFIFIPPYASRAQPTVRFNNFDEQVGLIEVYGGPTAPNDLDIDATNNYWGGLSTDEIDRLIHDKNDVTPDLAPYIGEVIYQPMEAAEIDSAGLP